GLADFGEREFAVCGFLVVKAFESVRIVAHSFRRYGPIEEFDDPVRILRFRSDGEYPAVAVVSIAALNDTGIRDRNRYVAVPVLASLDRVIEPSLPRVP